MYVKFGTAIPEGLMVKLNGCNTYFENCVQFMDDEIFEDIEFEEFENEQAFLDEYCKRHEEKFGEKFDL